MLRMVAREGLRLSALGVAIGLAASLGATRGLRSLLFGVTSDDPLTYAAIAAVLVLTALVASYLPARRASRVDPLVALRYEWRRSNQWSAVAVRKNILSRLRLDTVTRSI